MLRAVLDANQFISALINSRGPSADLFKKAHEGRFTILLSVAILEETYRALHYPRVKKYLSLDQENILAFFESLIEISQVVEGKLIVKGVKDDPDDDKYLACAIEGGADYIVSGDKHLLDLKSFEGIKMITAREFLKQL